MSIERGPWGSRLQALLSNASDECWIIAPFIKRGALARLLADISPNCRVVCVTRWLPRDVAQGVSDVEILEDFVAHKGSELRLLDHLHAKLFVGDNQCLVGSANVTMKGLGWSTAPNAELMVEIARANSDIASFLEEVYDQSRIASTAEAQQVLALAKSLPVSELGRPTKSKVWLPTSHAPQRAYGVYSSLEAVESYRTTVDETIMVDLARTDIPPGLSERNFYSRIGALLLELPVIREFVSEDSRVERLTESDFEELIPDLVDRGLASDSGLAFKALTLWIEEFLSDQIVVTVESEYVMVRGSKF